MDGAGGGGLARLPMMSEFRPASGRMAWGVILGVETCRLGASWARDAGVTAADSCARDDEAVDAAGDLDDDHCGDFADHCGAIAGLLLGARSFLVSDDFTHSGRGYPAALRGLKRVPVLAHLSPCSSTKKLYIRLNGRSVPAALGLFRTLRSSLNLFSKLSPCVTSFQDDLVGQCGK